MSNFTYISKDNVEKTVDFKDFDFTDLLNVYETSEFTYCKLNEIKEVCERHNLVYTDFTAWLYGQTLPVVEEEGEDRFNCVYECDTFQWLTAKIHSGRTPRVFD